MQRGLFPQYPASEDPAVPHFSWPSGATALVAQRGQVNPFLGLPNYGRIVVHPQQPQFYARPVYHHQSPGFVPPVPPAWGARSNSFLQGSTAPVSAGSLVQNLVTGIEQTCSAQHSRTWELKERLHAAASKVDDLKQLTQRIQHLSGGASLTKDHGDSSPEGDFLPPKPSAPEYSRASPQEVTSKQASITNPGKDLGLKQDNPKLLEKIGDNEELNTAHATAKVLKASIADLLEPFERIRTGKGTTIEVASWNQCESRQRKVKQYRHRRKKRRRQVAEKLREDREAFATLDTAADEWRAQRIAQDIARTRLQQIEKSANAEAQEKKRRLEQDVNSLLILERLQKLRNLRVAKLRRQGHVFPEEDDDFLARVQQSAQQEAAGAGASLADPEAYAQQPAAPKPGEDSEPSLIGRLDEGSTEALSQDPTQADLEGAGVAGRRVNHGEGPELRKYYHESTAEMGRLIEVRRAWDSFLSPDGSVIPGHWVVPLDPPGPQWARYLEKLGT